MSKSKTKLIYLMGAGRSGTTALATFLGASPEIQTLGEMHQFLRHIHEQTSCSCGKALTECSFWAKVLDKLSAETVAEGSKMEKLSRSVEDHSMIFQHLSKGKDFENADKYLPLMQRIFEACNQDNNQRALLDSAKYISRALALRHVNNIDLKVIYMVRDARGVVNSFSKQVQTSRGTISSILYYLTINITAQIVCWTGLRGKYKKVRYEDMMENPERFFNELEKFVEVDLKHTRELIATNANFDIGHIIGGNRLKINKTIKFRADTKWNESQSRLKQFLIYTCTLPVMLINLYPVFQKN